MRLIYDFDDAVTLLDIQRAICSLNIDEAFIKSITIENGEKK